MDERPEEPAPAGPADRAEPEPPGGDIPGVPDLPQAATEDELLGGRRFDVLGRAGNHDSLTWQLTDRRTGRRWFLRRVRPGVAEGEREIAAARLHRMLGHDACDAAFAVPGRQDLVVLEYAEDLPGVDRLLGAGQELLGDFADWEPGAADRLAARLADPALPLRLLLTDLVTREPDRHDGNWLAATVPGTGQVTVVPVDHAAAFRGPPAGADLAAVAGQGVHSSFLELTLRSLEQHRVTRAGLDGALGRYLDDLGLAARLIDLDDLGPVWTGTVRQELRAGLDRLHAHGQRLRLALGSPRGRQVMLDAVELLRARAGASTPSHGGFGTPRTRPPDP